MPGHSERTRLLLPHLNGHISGMAKKKRAKTSLPRTPEELRRAVHEAQALARTLSATIATLRVDTGYFEYSMPDARTLVGTATKMLKSADHICFLMHCLQPKPNSPPTDSKGGSVFVLKGTGVRKLGGRWGSGEKHH